MEHMVFEQVVGPVVNFLSGHITKHLGYVTCSSKHVNNMTKRMKDLVDTSDDVRMRMNRNNINNKEMPSGIPRWLTDVEDFKNNVQNISGDGIGCLNMKMRYRLGRKACKDTETKEELLKRNLEFIWTDAPKPFGRVDSKPALSSRLGGVGFKSRDTPFKNALKFLQQDDNKSQVIALCGMGGVGKTTMMKQLSTVASEKMMFNWIVKVAIGKNPNMFSIQNDIALQLGGEDLCEQTNIARADNLRTKFEKTLKDSKTRILVILDDVWGKVELTDIGLISPLPNGVKLLLTSRDSNICRQIAIDSHFQVVGVDVLEEEEAYNFFFQITGVSKDDDHDMYKVGCDIVKKCGCLPLAINIIGATLKSREKFVWRSTLQRLNKYKIDEDLQEIIEISYEYLRKEEKQILLLCSLFPEDFDIPIEDLTRYAWGLNFLNGVSTLGDTRDMTETCVENLINANMLIHSHDLGCVKMHDLVLAFVLGRVSKEDRAWIINHGGVSKWGGYQMSESCEIISLTCAGLSDLPRGFKFPNLSLLQLMDGGWSLSFPEEFYENMENLKVIAYYKMHSPLFPRSLQCSTNLKALCLQKCKLMFDFSSFGDLVNLEVLSFAHCHIRKLPSTIRNLKKLKLLDLTGCVDLAIDDGIFENLGKLEELYKRVYESNAIKFTDANCKELKTLSRQLRALEVEFVDEKMKKMSFKNLVNFKIFMGCVFQDECNENHISENTLKLVTNRKSNILDCKMNKLLKKTEKLHLQVKDMISLEDGCFSLSL